MQRRPFLVPGHSRDAHRRQRLQDRVLVRNEDAERKTRFLFAERRPVIPAWWRGGLGIFAWGNEDRRSKLPRTDWC